ncbi:hypothetical protein DA2_2576 [Desulfovibrio sp. A2]|nr:hypothetical protein DA2_2576 [Desulfovibrio sp. A2]
MTLKFEPESLKKELIDVTLSLSEYQIYSEELNDFLEESSTDDDDFETTISTESKFEFSISGVDETLSLSIQDLRNFTEELQTARIIDGLECVSNSRYLLKVLPHYDAENIHSQVLYYEHSGYFYETIADVDGVTYTCKVQTGFTIFAALAAKHMYYDKYLPLVTEDHFFIEVIHSKPVDIAHAREVAYAYLFELNTNLNISFDPSPRPMNVHFYDDTLEIESTLRFRPLLLGKGILELQKMFLKAASSADLEFKIISFVKVLEYVSQTATRNEINARIFSKLYRPDALNPTSEFVKELENEFKELSKFKKDKEAIKQTIISCCDYAELKPSISGFILKKIGKGDALSALDTISNVIVATRNQLSHAKTNYAYTGDECPFDELEVLCRILKICARQAIYWFNLQGESLRLA